jgi:hypothetical protein
MDDDDDEMGWVGEGPFQLGGVIEVEIVSRDFLPDLPHFGLLCEFMPDQHGAELYMRMSHASILLNQLKSKYSEKLSLIESVRPRL